MTWLSRGGTRLFVAEAGRGDPPLLFVHGWCGDHGSFGPQVAHFRRRHRVVAVDLRGHGRSDAPEQDYTIAGFADDLAWLCDRLALERPVVVGHSMGGVVGLALAARRPALPAAVVLLDAGVLIAQPLLERMRPLVAALHGPDYLATFHQIVAGMFLPTDDKDRRAHLVAAMAKTPQRVMASAFDDWLAFDAEAAIRGCRAPLLYVAAARPRSDLARFRGLCPDLRTGQVVGSGHFLQLEVPEQVNPMLERFLTVGLADSTTTRPDPGTG